MSRQHDRLVEFFTLLENKKPCIQDITQVLINSGALDIATSRIFTRPKAYHIHDFVVIISSLQNDLNSIPRRDYLNNLHHIDIMWSRLPQEHLTCVIITKTGSYDFSWVEVE